MLPQMASKPGPMISAKTKASIWALTQGISPSKYPIIPTPITQITAPTALNVEKVSRCIFDTPATKGAKVRMKGMKRAKMMAKGPHFAKKISL